MNISGKILYQVDSFTNKIFSGNPAGICVLEQSISEEDMQNISLEMNLSETAFLYREKDGFNLRWFTPTKEVNLCGHATLAAAHVLWTKNYVSQDQTAKFFTKSGELGAWREGDDICLDFPAVGPTRCEISSELSGSIGCEINYTGKNSQNDLLVVVNTSQQVLNFKPDLEIIKKQNIRGLILTAPSGIQNYDFISRFFAPSCGVNEDPVTGSAHCCLAPYWAHKLDKIKLTGYQASSRGGVVGCEVRDQRVILRGHAVSVFRIEVL